MTRVRALAIAVVLFGALPAGVVHAQGGDDPEGRLKALGLTLPTPAAPVANYVRAVRTGNLVFLAGHGECTPGQTGKAGAGVTVEQAYASARRVGLCLLASLKQEIGDLRKVRRVVKVLGMVNAAPEFADHPKVINGFSDLMVSVFGDRGRHARSAVGMGSLPGGITVEIEMIVEVAD
jgi:enamine deaminase RidA (YjgF/YER057c/UK114 family)